MSSFWYPSVSVTGAYLHMANRIEVEQPLSRFTDPAKDFIHSILDVYKRQMQYGMALAHAARAVEISYLDAYVTIKQYFA